MHSSAFYISLVAIFHTQLHYTKIGKTVVFANVYGQMKAQNRKHDDKRGEKASTLLRLPMGTEDGR